MRREYLGNGYYIGQKVVCISDIGPKTYRPYIPAKGTIGTVENYDSWDKTMSISWIGGFYPEHPEDDRVLTLWTNTEFVAPYHHDIAHAEDGRPIDDYTGAVVDGTDSDMTWVDETGWVCQDTLGRFFQTCDHCGRIYKKEDLVDVDMYDYHATNFSIRKCFCEDCLERDHSFHKCPDCGKWFDNRLESYICRYDGEYICRSCVSGYRECPECGDWYPLNNFAFVPGDDRLLCEKCRIRFRRRAIHNYSYKPDPKFKVGNSHEQFETDRNIKELLMGVELEIDKGEDDASCANEIVATIEDVYCKHDGSLSCGVEIVSHPCTLEYHLNELGWDKIIEIARKYKFTSHEAKTCGLHVHVGRRQLGSNDVERDETAGKLVLAMQRHWENMVKFSRRLSSQLSWAECNRVDFDYVENESQLIDAALETEDDGRYQAVNLCNTNTVEFRIFRGTLELNTIKATLELVSNMCEYCKTHTAFETMNSQWDDIAYYKEYPELCNYLIDRNLAQTSLIDRLPDWDYPANREKEKVEARYVEPCLVIEDPEFSL